MSIEFTCTEKGELKMMVYIIGTHYCRLAATCQSLLTDP